MTMIFDPATMVRVIGVTSPPPKKLCSLTQCLRDMGIDAVETEGGGISIDSPKSDGSFVCPICSQPGKGTRGLHYNPHGRISAIIACGDYVGFFCVHPECLLLLPDVTMEHQHITNVAGKLMVARKAYKDPKERQRAWEQVQSWLMAERQVIESAARFRDKLRESRRQRILYGLERGPDPKAIL